jgi:hypothetical protein
MINSFTCFAGKLKKGSASDFTCSCKGTANDYVIGKRFLCIWSWRKQVKFEVLPKMFIKVWLLEYNDVSWFNCRDDGISRVVWNVGTLLPVYMALPTRRQDYILKQIRKERSGKHVWAPSLILQFHRTNNILVWLNTYNVLKKFRIKKLLHGFVTRKINKISSTSAYYYQRNLGYILVLPSLLTNSQGYGS